MDDLRDRMERLASRVDTAAAPDLGQVRERHARRRRTSALTVGVGLMVIVALVAIQVSRSAPEPSAVSVSSGWELPATLTLWPSPDTAGAPWRQAPELAVTRFAQTVLGWSTPDLTRLTEAGSEAGGFDVGPFDVVPTACEEDPRCSPLGVGVELVEGGYAITTVGHPDLRIEVDPTETIPAGGAVGFDLAVDEARSAHVGLVASNGCREVSSFEVALSDGRFSLPVPDAPANDPACSAVGAGYVFAYVTDDTTVPVGDPFLEAAAIEYPWLTAIPVMVQMEDRPVASVGPPPSSGPGTAPSPLRVSCGSDGVTHVSSGAVTATPEGVHVNLDGEVTPFEVTFQDSAGVQHVRRVNGSGQPLVVPLAPGGVKIGCSIGDRLSETAVVEIRDPGGYWVDPESLCTVAGIADFEPITVPEDGPFASPVLGMFGLSEGSFEAVGYGASVEERIFVVFDVDERPVGVVWFEPDPGGTWTSTGLATCA